MTDFDPSKNKGLQSLRIAWPQRDPDDRPGAIVARIEAERIVYRALTPQDMLDAIESYVVGEVE